MRLSRLSVLIALLCCAGSLRAGAQEPPSPSVDEQIGTCVRIEDSDPGRALAIAGNLLATGGSLSPQQLAAATACRGWARINTGQREAAFVDAHAVLSTLQALPPSVERVRLLRRAGGILHRGGDRVGAIDFYARAEADTEALGLDAERIPLLVNLGVLHSEFEQHERARVNYEQALMLMTRLDDFRHEAAVRFNLGLNYAGQRRHDEAATQLRRALDLLSAEPSAHPGQRVVVEMALAQALLSSGDEAGARVITNELRRRDASLLDQAAKTQLAILEAEQLAAGDQTHAALSVVDGLLAANAHTLSDIQRWHLLKVRSTLLERLGRFQEAATTLREVNAVREAHMRHLNHEHLAALDAHMRDREQRHELERLQAQSLLQAQELRANRRLQATGVALAALLTCLAAIVFIWQRRMNRRLLTASHTDHLTRLRNRRSMSLHLRELGVARAQTALLLLDIDDFKMVNDQYGHDVGDEVLVAYAQRLLDHAGSAAKVARWGGEEFLIALPGLDATGAQAVADAVQHRLSAPIDTRKGALTVKVSIGIANLPLNGIRSETAWHHSLQLADAALYRAKRLGRSMWVCYWLDRPVSGWSPERVASETELAHSTGVLQARTSRVPDRPVETASSSPAH